MKTYYDLLGVAPSVSVEEIKRAFRKEIARYHPDKVQHLGSEFQEIAAVRAAELTEAYRILMDEDARSRYDQSLRPGGGAGAAPPASRASAAPAQDYAPPGQPHAAPQPEDRPASADPQFRDTRATVSDFVRTAGLSRLREAIAAVDGGAAQIPLPGFDAAFDVSGKGGLFRKADPAVRLLVKFVPVVDQAAVIAAWPLAARAGAARPVCLLLLGAGGMASAKELSVTVAEQRRKARSNGPIIVPVDVRDWDALFPPDAPACARAVLQRLRKS